MTKLPSATCPTCGRQLESDEFRPNAKGGAPAATSYQACLRRCESCGIALSNARENPVAIHRRPSDNVPAEIRDGFSRTLAAAVHEGNRANKEAKACFETSEDAVTWTVFRYLQQSRQLSTVLAHLLGKPPLEASKNPTMLLWGVPVPADDQIGISAQHHLFGVLDSIPEQRRARSEPDVIVDFGDQGLVIIEVKYRSGNEVKLNYPPFEKYLVHTDAFGDADAIRRSGYYELTRNWRIGHDLATSHPFTLINLGPERLFDAEKERLHLFRQGLREGHRRRFVTLTWPVLLAGIPESLPGWLQAYVHDRQLLS